MWNKLNSYMKFIIIQAIVMIAMWFYLRIDYGIYKHKYINELENKTTEFKQRLNDIEIQRKENTKALKIKTKNLEKDVIKIENKRIKIEHQIDIDDVSDAELKRFLSRFKESPEPP